MATPETRTPFSGLPCWSICSQDSLELCSQSPEIDQDNACDVFTRGRLHHTDGTVTPCCACAVRIVEARKAAR